MSEYPQQVVWTEYQISQEISKHANDPDWNPLEILRPHCESALYVVKKLNGDLVPPPQTNNL